MNEENKIECSTCSNKYTLGDLRRHCSNCFACTGCEIYICPNCDARIVVREGREMKRRNEEL